MTRRNYGLGMLALLLVVMLYSCARDMNEELMMALSPYGQRQPYETDGVWCTSEILTSHQAGIFHASDIHHPAGNRKMVSRFVGDILDVTPKQQRTYRFVSTVCYPSWKVAFGVLPDSTQERASAYHKNRMSEKDYRNVVLDVQYDYLSDSVVRWLEEEARE